MDKSIAVIGGGFSGLSVISNLIQRLRSEKKKASVTLFSPQIAFEGIAYSTTLSNSFRLNHEASYMGIMNPLSQYAGYDDFFVWIQENKGKKMDMLSGDTIANIYHEFELHNPNTHLPRSLYGYYLKHRFEELLAHSYSDHYEFTYKKYPVTNIEKYRNVFRVYYGNTYSFFGTVVLCTGDVYGTGESPMLSSSDPQEYLHNPDILPSHEVGIVGTALSAIETANALADKGYKKITMVSRKGRLPRLRGKTFPYTPKYITAATLRRLRATSVTVAPVVLFDLIKKELDYAYKEKGAGLYQKVGINWDEIIRNTNPLVQLDEDIRLVKEEREMIWRSVLFSVNDLEMDFWDSLAHSDCKTILDLYASLILCYFSPMPLYQAEKLREYLQSGAVHLRSEIIRYTLHNNKWILYFRNNTNITVDHLIDARGYSQEASTNELLTSLIHSGLLEKHPVFGIHANKYFQIIHGITAYTNLYAVGAMLNGVRPLKASTPYIHQFAREVAYTIVWNIK